jgi:hypothetical protein
MLSANRSFIIGQSWHITHRCDNREFLLLDTRNRTRGRHWTRFRSIAGTSRVAFVRLV